MSELDLEGLERVARADEDTDVLALVAEVRRLRESGRLIAQTAKNRKAEVHAVRAQRDAVLAIHRRVAVYTSADLCTDETHADEQHSENADGEWLCYATPLPDEDVCSTCTDTVGDWPEPYLWPCATARALGVTE